MSGPTSLSSYSSQINTTHPHTSGGWCSFSTGNSLQGGVTSFSAGFYIPHPPPKCFDATHQSPRTRSDLLPSNSFALKRLDPTQSLSHSIRSPAISFVSSSTPKPTRPAYDQTPGPGEYDVTHKEKHDRKMGIGGSSFNQAKKQTGKRWESTTGDLPGPGAYGICEIPIERTSSPRFCSDLALERPELQDVP